MSNEMAIETMEIMGATIKSVMGAFESETQSNRETAVEMIKTCENNEVTYRRMLESDSYTFEQKREIREWVEHEKACQKAIDEDRRKHDDEHLACGVAFGAFVLVSAIAIVDHRCAKGIAKALPTFIPKVSKFLKVA